MSTKYRTELEQEIVNDFVEKAINFDEVGRLIAKYGARAALTGTSLASIINRNAVWNCGWPGPEISQALKEQNETGG